LLPDDRDPQVPLDEAAEARLYRMSNLLMLSALSSNEYGYHNSWCANARMFQLHVARFPLPPGYVNLLGRRRDGTSVTVGARWGDALFYVPTECNPPMTVSVDQRLASSLGCLEDGHPLARRLRLALPFFAWANTLAETSSWEMEIIALVAAFEKLLGRGGRSGVADEVQRLLGPYDSVPVRNAPRLARPNIRAKAAQQEDPVRRPWVDELYYIRNGLAHPRPADIQNLAWHPHEHLAMGALLFPLLVKLLLAQNGLYDLTLDDKAACDAVDMLLAETVWFNWEEFAGSECDHYVGTNWAATLCRAKRARGQKESVEIAKRVLERQE
jgi:hypothetical protein